ncbi:MAG: hypothetical protein QOE96_2839 [Blastocatellia bacterium]|jgi:hypothetical protein|nr:hypothetical protein [Blastocatellia bacterium]
MRGCDDAFKSSLRALRRREERLARSRPNQATSIYSLYDSLWIGDSLRLDDSSTAALRNLFGLSVIENGDFPILCWSLETSYLDITQPWKEQILVAHCFSLITEGCVIPAKTEPSFGDKNGGGRSPEKESTKSLAIQAKTGPATKERCRVPCSLTKRYEPVFTRLAVVKVSLRLATYQHVRPPILAPSF